jgi:hypothetical protein
MCGGGPDLPPEKDPKVEREKVATEATVAANAKAAAGRRAKRSQSLLSTGGMQGAINTAATSSVLAQGKTTLGG